MKAILSIVMFLVAAISCYSQNFAEVRTSFTKDGFAEAYFDYSYTFKNGVLVDVSYYGSPGSHEVWTGVGYQKEIKGFSVGNAVYLVVGNKKQLGVGLASFGEGKVKKLNLDYEAYAFAPTRGPVPRYLSIDHVDLTKSVGKRFEAGGSVGLYLEKGSKAYKLAGGVFRINDKLGSTSFYLRGGSAVEFRVSRTFNF